MDGWMGSKDQTSSCLQANGAGDCPWSRMQYAVNYYENACYDQWFSGQVPDKPSYEVATTTLKFDPAPISACLRAGCVVQELNPKTMSSIVVSVCMWGGEGGGSMPVSMVAILRSSKLTFMLACSLGTVLA